MISLSSPACPTVWAAADTLRIIKFKHKNYWRYLLVTLHDSPTVFLQVDCISEENNLNIDIHPLNW